MALPVEATADPNPLPIGWPSEEGCPQWLPLHRALRLEVGDAEGWSLALLWSAQGSSIPPASLPLPPCQRGKQFLAWWNACDGLSHCNVFQGKLPGGGWSHPHHRLSRDSASPVFKAQVSLTPQAASHITHW